MWKRSFTDWNRLCNSSPPVDKFFITSSLPKRVTLCPPVCELCSAGHLRFVADKGFDDARLDTLFLTLPISWRGTLIQYARLHRLNEAKKKVIIYDYVDFEVPVVARMYAKRRSGYESIGYEIILTQELNLDDF